MQINLNKYVSSGRESTDEDPSLSKRLKINSNINLDDYKAGSIIKLKLTNFVTYRLTEFTLSPSLNMIIGPNGSGKSTFVCAVCLGLAGKTEFIGRMKNVNDFIKNGEDFCTIETFLKGSADEGEDEGSIVKITRIIYRNKKRSVYKINNKECTESRIRDLVIKKFNIQLDNLCQFLSQERVEEFARLKSDKLLIETVRSIDPTLLTYLNNLKSLQDKEISLQKDIDIKSDRLNHLKIEQEKLSEMVSILEDYDKKKLEISYHSDLLPYVLIKDHKLKYESYKNDYKQAKINLKNVVNERIPYQDLQNDLEAKLQDSIFKRDNIKTKVNSLITELNKSRDNLSQIRENTNKKKGQIEYYRNRTQKIKDSIKKTNDDIIQRKENLEKYKEILPSDEDMKTIDDESAKLITRQQSIQTQKSSIGNRGISINHDLVQLERQLQGIKNRLNTTDKIFILDKIRNAEDVREAVRFIRSQGDNIVGKILEPPIMTVSVDDATIASYLNSCVDQNTSKALTITDSATYERYSGEILKRFKVNLREIRPNFNMEENRLSIDELRSFGFDGYISDHIKGDPKVIEMLCQVSRIHLIPFSRRELSESQLTRLIQPRDNMVVFPKFIQGQYLYTVLKSNHASGQVFSRDSPINRTNLYQTSIMTDKDKNEINRNIKEKMNEINSRKAQLENLSTNKGELDHEYREIENKLRELNSKSSKYNNIRTRYTLLNQDIKSLNEKIDHLKLDAKKDVTQKIQDVEQSISELLKEQTESLKTGVLKLKELNIQQRELLNFDLKLFEIRNAHASLNEILGSFLERERELTEEYETKKRVVKEMRDTEEYKSWMAQIRSYNEELKVKLNELAEQYEVDNNFNTSFIQEKIDRLESEIATINHDTSAITILKQVEAELQELETTLPGYVKNLSVTKSEMKENHDQLEPKLDSIVSEISSKFAELFKNVGSAGAVNLEKPHRYDEWQIQIMVKFRDNAPLKKLDSHTQSGGERAVSTVLFMIALQGFTAAPFRVVDEINQGMDQRNERIVHKAMVENACAKDTSQYFLITPKLLTDLHYHENMRIHCVMAGPWIPNPSKHPEMIHFGETTNYVL